MMRSLYSGVAGLKTHQTRMDVIGNNIANVNTTAFKSSAVNFQDVMYQNLSNASGPTDTTGGVNAKQIGLGVTTGATKISITNGGSAQSTGDALDIRLSDGKATNFLIVNNGSSNLFTRSGSLFLDSAGNLAMTTTGYLVQGWQATEDAQGNRTISKDIVSTLRINSPENQTSNPEATTQAHVTGVADKTDTNMTSESGKAFTLGLYDNLGYSYTARFTMKVFDANAGTYTVKLTNIYDDDNNDVLKQWMNLDTTNNTLGKIFGDKDSEARTEYTLGTEYSLVNGYLCYSSGGKTYYSEQVSNITQLGTSIDFTEGTMGSDGTVTSATGATPIKKTLSDIYGYSGSTTVGSTTSPLDGSGSTIKEVKIDSATGKLDVTVTDTNCKVQYNTADGSFSYIIDDDGADNTTATQGGVSALLKLSLMRNQGGSNTDKPFLDGLRDITMDFSSTKNLENSGNATIAADGGMVSNNATGRGKALGTLTGISIAQNGMIYGSYSNGNTTLLGQIAVAQFANASGLESVGNNCYNTTLNSGDFDGIGTDITSDGGKMQTGQLEMSNVDLAQEFTDMITTQRGFQANSRIITVSDTLLEELTNLKR